MFETAIQQLVAKVDLIHGTRDSHITSVEDTLNPWAGYTKAGTPILWRDENAQIYRFTTGAT